MNALLRLRTNRVLLTMFLLTTLSGCVEFKGDLALISKDENAAKWMSENAGLWIGKAVEAEDEADRHAEFIIRIAPPEGNKAVVHTTSFDVKRNSKFEDTIYSAHGISATDGYLLFARPADNKDDGPTAIIWYLQLEGDHINAFIYARNQDGVAESERKSIEIVTEEDIKKLQEDPLPFFDPTKVLKCIRVDVEKLFNEGE